MTREQAKQEIKSRYADYLKPAKNHTFICPLCQNGTGDTKDGLALDPHSEGCHLKCFKCGFYGDLIDLYQAEHGCGFETAVQDLSQRFGLPLDAPAPTTHPAKQETVCLPFPEQAVFLLQANANATAADYERYFSVARSWLTAPEALAYLSKRGISLQTAQRFGLGFDPRWRSPAALAHGKNPPTSPRLILPTSGCSYVARDIRPDLPPEKAPYAKIKQGTAAIFNLGVLYHPGKPVFVTEGEFDALSIAEAGGEAIALGSVSNVDKLLGQLKAKPTPNKLILCLDNDQAGEKASKRLVAGLNDLGVCSYTPDLLRGSKDPNLALQTDRPFFLQAVEGAICSASSHPDNVTGYLQCFFEGEVERFRQSSTRQTGFPNLDRVAHGIYPGLYVLGAISSLGKTTFVHQMADQMAQAGENVLYFSLEQSRLEMVSKSLSRITAQMDEQFAVTSLQIRSGLKNDSVKDAIATYQERVRTRMNVIEGNFNTTVSSIRAYIERYSKENQVKPVVVIDYLQILPGDPAWKKTGTRENIDANVTALKQLSREHDLPVFLISSLNRSNYLVPIDFESFKESGGIEYTADVVWGLQLSVLHDSVFQSEGKLADKRERIRKAKAEIPRKVELVCLKNRYGISSYQASFAYYPQYDWFQPVDTPQATQPQATARWV